MMKNSGIALVFIFCCATGYAQKAGNNLLIGKIVKASVILKKVQNEWGINVNGAGQASVTQPKPVQIQVYTDSANITDVAAGYKSVVKTAEGFMGKAAIKIGSASFNVTDNWTIAGNTLQLARKVLVNGNDAGKGFLSAIKFSNQQNQTRADVNYFAPGMIYGTTDHITDVAIGGKKSGLITWIREDRLPAPMFGIYYKDGSSFSILDPKPDGATTVEDSHDTQIKTLIDGGFRFGAIGAEEINQKLDFGFVWPGTEGAYTYRGRMFPGGQLNKWRRRYHPVTNGFVQQYQVAFRIGQDDAQFTGYYKNAWRWAWNVLNPPVYYQNIELVRRSLIDMLGDRIETHNGLTGLSGYIIIPNPEDKDRISRKTLMGFTGKALEVANYLLQDADRRQSPLDEKHRQQGIDIINSFVKTVSLSPPVSDGFNMDTGKPEIDQVLAKRLFLRSFGDDLKALMKAVKRERAQGREHPEWIKWAQSFADWLLPQQSPEGGFPRAWQPQTGKLIDGSQQSSFTVIPFLNLLSEVTANPIYQQAAIKAGEFCWRNGQNRGMFVGGTNDNPDVMDKEAGTLSLEAYLSLYNTTNDKKWIERARAAANYAETWIYIWNVPMPDGDKIVQWQKGVPTVGIQLISTGHSLADMYMSFDVDEYAKLSVFANDAHYLNVARILLHDTKSMLAIPGRLYNLPGPGWQQEHWSVAPVRGYGQHKAWLPWVSTSHLNGIFGLEEFDKTLFKKLSQKN